ncbi:MAG: XRE family transcriptional regulator [Actinomycetia bacterium]|nr:XRE family transcriptional regulator [Actinomycetes bacterium]
MNGRGQGIGDRVRSVIPEGMSQREFAGHLGMTPDALSRALSGQRGFAPVELGDVAALTGQDLHWLISGRRDPWRLDPAARHQWDADTGGYSNPGRVEDDELLATLLAVYRAAYPGGPPGSPDLPGTASAVRDLLGADFVELFSDRVEEHLGIDIIRLPRLSTSYSLRVGSRGVIVLSATPNWFYSNWSLAHELGHLALGHHATESSDDINEREANAFAAELLLPADAMGRVHWSKATRSEVAEFLWESGVSTLALRNRLTSMRLGAAAVDSLEQATQKYLRAHLPPVATGSPRVSMAQRERQAAERRYPAALHEDLRARVEEGEADPALLAWLLDTPVSEVDFPASDEEAAAAAYADMVRASSAADWTGRFRSESSA